MKTALITGASSGIGEEFAKLFAKDKINLVLVARNENKLKELASELYQQFGVDVKVLPKDLSVLKQTEEIFNELHKKTFLSII